MLHAISGAVGFTKLQDSVLPAAGTFDFQNIPATYIDLVLAWQVRGTNATAVVIYVQFNNDSGANYHYQLHNAASSSPASSAAVSQNQIVVGTAAGSSDTAGRTGSGFAYIPNYAGTTFHKMIRGNGGRSTGDAAGNQQVETNQGVWLNTAAINRITITPDAGSTFVTGSRVTLYATGSL